MQKREGKRAQQQLLPIVKQLRQRKGGVKGYDGGKKIKGRKRHILVDTQGLLLQAKVSAGSISDKEGLTEILKDKQHRTVRKIWGDAAYQGKDLENIALSYGIELEIVKRPPGRVRIYNEEWRAVFYPIKRDFTILPRRWVVERTYAWMGRNRRLSKDYEYLPQMSESYLYLAMSRVVLRRLVKNRF